MKTRTRLPDLVEDIEWLLECGESASRIPARLGYAQYRSLVRQLERAGRLDLARIIRAEAA